MLKIITKIYLLLTLFIFFSCATISKSYNTPFINTDETITLEYGMKKNTVLNNLENPLYVERGNKSTKEIVWVYEVRTIEVKSDILMGGKISVTKISDDTKHAGPIHRIELIFVDNKLFSWGPMADNEEKEETVAEKENNATQNNVKKEEPTKELIKKLAKTAAIGVGTFFLLLFLGG